MTLIEPEYMYYGLPSYCGVLYGCYIVILVCVVQYVCTLPCNHTSAILILLQFVLYTMYII